MCDKCFPGWFLHASKTVCDTAGCPLHEYTVSTEICQGELFENVLCYHTACPLDNGCLDCRRDTGACTWCPVGEQGAGFGCAACPAGYALGTSVKNGQCKQCDTVAQRSSSDRTRCYCNKNYYHDMSKAQGAPEYVGDCLPCPNGGVCDGDDALPRAAIGYYSSPDMQFAYIACVPAEACAGNDECAPGYAGVFADVC